MANNPFIYNFLNSKAQKAYKVVDYIGCMSQGNIEFVKKIAPKINHDKIVLLPNWQKLESYTPPKPEIRQKFGLQGKFVAVFGGTIGVGQDINNIITLAKHYKNNESIVFLIIGKGIRKNHLLEKAKQFDLHNIRFLDFLPRNEYNNLIKSVDLGIISIDHRYNVPTCPSKVIGYMAMKIPVIAMINKNSDYAQMYIKEPYCGVWSEGLDNKKMIENFQYLYENKEARRIMGESGYNYYKRYFTTQNAFNHIVNALKI